MRCRFNLKGFLKITALLAVLSVQSVLARDCPAQNKDFKPVFTNPNMITFPKGSDTDLSCRAILCLAHPKGWAECECQDALKKFYSWDGLKYWDDTLKARENFLRICPTTQTDQNGNKKELEGEQKRFFNELLNTLKHHGGGCDIGRINRQFQACPTTNYDGKISECKEQDFKNVEQSRAFKTSSCYFLSIATYTDFSIRPKWKCTKKMTRGEILAHNDKIDRNNNSSSSYSSFSKFRNSRFSQYKKYQNIDLNEEVCVSAEWVYPFEKNF